MTEALDQGIPPYPPDKILGLDSFPWPISFTTILVSIGVLAAVIDFIRGIPSTPVPYNYPFYGDILLVVMVPPVIQWFHRSINKVKNELVFLSRTCNNHFHSEGIEPGQIRNTFDWANNVFFHPIMLFGPAFFLGCFVYGVLIFLDVLTAYPYHLMNFTFGAIHGLALGPLVAGFYLLVKVVREFIICVNPFDPDGVGGYYHLGEIIGGGMLAGIIGITLDLVILSSILFTQASSFQIVVMALYIFEFIVISGGLLVGAYLIRRRLRILRDKHTRRLQWEFTQTEGRFWASRRAGHPSTDEAIALMTMSQLHEPLSRMNLWPANMPYMVATGASVLISLSIFIIQLLIFIE